MYLKRQTDRQTDRAMASSALLPGRASGLGEGDACPGAEDVDVRRLGVAGRVRRQGSSGDAPTCPSPSRLAEEGSPTSTCSTRGERAAAAFDERTPPSQRYPREGARCTPTQPLSSPTTAASSALVACTWMAADADCVDGVGSLGGSAPTAACAAPDAPTANQGLLSNVRTLLEHLF